MTHYILVKVEAIDVEAVILAVDAALDGDDIYKQIGGTLVCDIKNPEVRDVLDTADLNQTRTETRIRKDFDRIRRTRACFRCGAAPERCECPDSVEP